MSIFGVPIWRIITAVILIIIVVNRGNIVAFFAKRKYGHKDHSGAAKIFNVASKIGNMSISNQILMGYNYLRIGELEKARVALNTAVIYSKPKSVDRFSAKNVMALVEWKMGNIDEAIAILEEVLDDGYRKTVIYQNLGLLYNVKGDAEKAVEFSKKALDFNGDDSIILDNTAESYALSGDFEKAAEIYEKLIERENPPHFPEAYYGYGKVLIELGEKERGLEMIKESLNKPFVFLSTHTKEEIEQLYDKLSNN